MATLNLTGTVTAAQDSSGLELQTFFDARTLEVAEMNLPLRQFAVVRPLPARHSKTIQFTRFEKLTVSTVAATRATALKLTEGTVPSTPQAMTITTITATVDQWGAFIRIADLAELTFFHPVVEESLYLLGIQAAETIHYEIQTVLDAGTTVQYAGGKAARSSVAATDKMSTAEIIKAVKTLRNNSGRTFNGYFVAVVHPNVEADLLRDATFVEATRYAAAERLYKGEISRFYGCIFVRAESLITYSSTVTVYPTFVIAQYAYAITHLQDLRVIHHPPGSAGTADPLNQLRTLGWKCSFKAAILNNNWLVRIESAAS
jgi:N4-gp56 family major capsid protein